MSEHAKEVTSGERFAFGKNWSQFYKELDEDHILEAENSLKTMLGVDAFSGRHFLDLGSGSGLFSLAARRLGASVYSFDYDPQSVECAEALKERYFPQDQNWFITTGSILDLEWIKSIGTFDIVYSWGVLHHTGSMWKALEYVDFLVVNGGTLFIALYNDQGRRSLLWREVKRIYCSGLFGRVAMLTLFFPGFFFIGLISDLIRFKNPLDRYLRYKKSRGMSVITDWIDWLGGYPFEVAKPGQVADFYRNKNYDLNRMILRKGQGCNQYIFVKKRQACN